MTEWFRHLSSSDRRVLMLGIILIVPLLAYQFIISPLEKKIEQRTSRLQNKQQAINDLLDIITKYHQLGGAKQHNKRKISGGSLLSIIDNSTDKLQIKKNIKRINPEGGRKVRVQFEKVSFDSVTLWIALLAKTENIHVDTVSFRKTKKRGIVSGKVSLIRE